MSEEPDLGAVNERSNRNAQDIQKLWRTSSEQGKEVVRIQEQLGQLTEGQAEAKAERLRHGQLLDGMATVLGVDDVPPGAPPAAGMVAVGAFTLPWWFKWLLVGLAGALAVAGAVAEALGLVNVV